MPIKIEITALNPGDLQTLLAELSPLLKDAGVRVGKASKPQSTGIAETVSLAAIVEPMDMGDEVTDPTNADAPDTEDTVETPTKSRGRPPGAKNKPKDKTPEEAPATPASAADAPSDNRKLLDDAIARIHVLFNKDPATAAKVMALRAKYGNVKKFIDIPLDRVLELVEDIEALEREAP